MWAAKQQLLCALTEGLHDGLNYGLFQPAAAGRDAKFLDEERPLRDYPQSFEQGVPYLEVGGAWGTEGAGLQRGRGHVGGVMSVVGVMRAWG